MRNFTATICLSRQAPVDLSEKWMTLDIVGTTQTWAEALTADWVEEGSDEGPHFRFCGFFPRAFSTTSREEERSVG